MYKEVKFTDIAGEALKQLINGAFLTVKGAEKVNTMTIGWGSVGYIWGRPVFDVLIRQSRYTHELMETAEDFTISFPIKRQLKRELAGCGIKSGRDLDKIAEYELPLRKSDTVRSPSIDGCDLIIECKTIYKSDMTDQNLDPAVRASAYPDRHNLHTIYSGEILKALLSEEFC